MLVPNEDMELCQNAPHRVKAERFLRRKQRKALKRQRKYKRRKHSKKRHLTEYLSLVMTCLNNSSFALPFQSDSATAIFKLPKVFCISKNPDESIQFLRKLYGAATNFFVNNIQFDYSLCVDLGICALTIMDIILTECGKWRKSLKSPIKYSNKLVPSGQLSQNPEIDRLLKVSGILKYAITDSDPSDEHSDDEELLELQTGGVSSDIATLIIYNRNTLQLPPCLTAAIPTV